MNIKKKLTIFKYARFIIWFLEIVLWITYVVNIPNIYNALINNRNILFSLTICFGIFLVICIFAIPKALIDFGDKYCIVTKSRIIKLLDEAIDEKIIQELNENGIEIKLINIDRYIFYKSTWSNRQEIYRVYIKDLELFRKYKRGYTVDESYRERTYYEREKYVSWEVLCWLYCEVRKVKRKQAKETAEKDIEDSMLEKNKREQLRSTLEDYVFNNEGESRNDRKN